MIDIRRIWFRTLRELLDSSTYCWCSFTCVAYHHKAGRKETHPTTGGMSDQAVANFIKACIFDHSINISMEQVVYLPSTIIH